MADSRTGAENIQDECEGNAQNKTKTKKSKTQ